MYNSNCVCVGTAVDPCLNNTLNIAQSAYDCPTTGGQWSLTLTVSGGAAPYVIVGNYTDGSFAGGAFTFNGDDGSNVDILVTDANGCTETYSAFNVLCIKCLYSIEMVGAAQSVCGNQSVSATYLLSDDEDQFPQNGVIIYAIHTNSNPVAGTILGTNTTGIFNFSQLSGAMYGTTYYLSAIAGPDNNGDGVPDLTDPCTKVAVGVPVTFNTGGSLTVTLDDDCNHETGETTVLIFVSGGSPSPYYTLSGTLSGQYTAAQFPQSVVVPDGGTVSINAMDGSACSATGSAYAGPLTCTKYPIELIDFSGKVLNQGNMINWTTGSEVENHHFTLYRSNDGIQFTEIASVAGAGTVFAAKSYSFLDAKAPAGISYYRLSQTDYNGTITTANQLVTLVREGHDLQITAVNPNPTVSDAVISFFNPSNGLAEIRVVDVTGKLIQNKMVNAINGINNVSINLSASPRGVYFVSVTSAHTTVSTKVIKD